MEWHPFTRQGENLRIVPAGHAQTKLASCVRQRDSQRQGPVFYHHRHQVRYLYSKRIMNAINEEGSAFIALHLDPRNKCVRLWQHKFCQFLFVALVCAVLTRAPSAEALQIESFVPSVEQSIQNAGPFGPLLFVSLYALSAVLLVPASFLTIAAGFLFGPIAGSVLVSVAATSGAALAFVIGRYIARPLVEDKIQSDERFSAIDRAIGKEGSAVVFLLRLSPIFPYGLLNYALSLTSVTFLDYIIASWLGMLPGTIAYVALGSAGKAATDGSSTSLWQVLLYIVGALSTLGVTIVISRVATKALRDMDE